MLAARNAHGRRFNFDNDITHLFFDIVLRASEQLAVGKWTPAVQGYAAHYGATEEHLLQAMTALTRFCELTTKDRAGRDLATTWVNAGLDRLPSPALVLLLYQIGAGTIAAFHEKARHAVDQYNTVPWLGRAREAVGRLQHTLTAPTPSVAAARQADTWLYASDAVARNAEETESTP